MKKARYDSVAQIASIALFVMALGPLTALVVASDSIRDVALQDTVVPQQSKNPYAPYDDTASSGDVSGKRLADIAEGSGTFEVFRQAVATAGLDGLLSGPESYTLFIPTDEAFAKLSSDRLDQVVSDPQAAREFLAAHIVPGRLSATDLMYQDYAKALTGNVLPLRAAAELRVADARVVATEAAENGVVHVVDAVL